MSPDNFISSETECFNFNFAFYKVNVLDFNYLIFHIYCLLFVIMCVGVCACMWYVHVSVLTTLL